MSKKIIEVKLTEIKPYWRNPRDNEDEAKHQFNVLHGDADLIIIGDLQRK